MFFKSDNYQGFNQSNKAGEFSPYKLWKEYEMQSKSWWWKNDICMNGIWMDQIIQISRCHDSFGVIQ